jgi:hypothetical protein
VYPLSPAGYTHHASDYIAPAHPPNLRIVLKPWADNHTIGTNFLTGAQVRLYRGTTLIYTAPLGTVNSSTQITTSFTLPETVVVGVTDVRVTNTDALYGTLPNGYIILE